MKYIISAMILGILFYGCEKDITIDLPSPEDAIVVEGHIENGEVPYVILTRNVGFFEAFDIDALADFFVLGADVKVSDGTNTITFTEFSFDSSGLTGSIYVGLGMIGEIGKTYSLTIKAAGKTLTAKTSLLGLLPLDSLSWEPHSHTSGDTTLVRLIAYYSDPDTLGNFVRYFTRRNSEPEYPGLFSVFDDQFINGTTFDFPLDRGQGRTEGFSNEYGLFNIGDTIEVNWSAIDKAHFDFWETWESTVNSNGSPFGTPTTVLTNIEGGLGIWGGYSSSKHTIIIP